MSSSQRGGPAIKTPRKLKRKPKVIKGAFCKVWDRVSDMLHASHAGTGAEYVLFGILPDKGRNSTLMNRVMATTGLAELPGQYGLVQAATGAYNLSLGKAKVCAACRSPYSSSHDVLQAR